VNFTAWGLDRDPAYVDNGPLSMFGPAGILAATLVFLSAGYTPVRWALADSVAGRQTSLRTYQLARIEFTGLRQLSQSRVLAISGLRANTLVTQRDVEAASSRLLDSCLFSSVSHRYRMQGYGLIVTFVLEEAPWNTSLVGADYSRDFTRQPLISSWNSPGPTLRVSRRRPRPCPALGP